jgi:thiamine-monophosphate kinase
MSPENRRIAGLLELTKRFGVANTANNAVKVSVLDTDDCAVMAYDEHSDLVVGSDFVRGEGFSLFKAGYLSRKDLGYYLVGANVSDIAAMGAKPLGVLTAVRYTPELTDDQFLEIMEGVCTACADMKCALLGGDTGGYHASVLSATALGLVPKNRPLLRRNARPGDLLVLSGEVGIAGAAFELCKAGLIQTISPGSDLLEYLLNPWRKVSPALLQGSLLTEHGLSTCGMDTSDGLKTSCQSIANASNVDVVLIEEMLPLSSLLREAALLLNRSIVSVACSDSVDFRLLFTVRASNRARFEAIFTQSNAEFHIVGRIEQAKNPIAPHVYLETNGKLGNLHASEKIQ